MYKERAVINGCPQKAFPSQNESGDALTEMKGRLMKNYRNRWIAAITVIVLLVLANYGSLNAQSISASEKKSCLWKVSTGKSELYLLGSIHFLKKENYPLPATMEKAFAGADSVVFEMDLDSAGSGNQQMVLLSKGMYQDNQSLSKKIGKDSYELARKSMNSFGLPIEQMEKFKPWFISLTLMTLKLQMSGFNPEYGVDKHFFTESKKTGKRIISLETFEEQTDMFDGLPEKDQEMLLVQTVTELERMDSEVRELVNAWSRGDADKMEKMILKSYRDHPVLYERLVLQRNKKWLLRIGELLNQRGTHIMIVGAGHLVGRDGLVSELQQRGYTITQQ